MGCLIMFCLVVTAAEDNEPLAPGDVTRMLTVDERERTYLVHVPESYDGGKAVPVVLVLHGGATNAQSMARFSGLNAKADKEGFLAVYPNGTGPIPRVLTWNGGNCCGYSVRNKVDDVKFIRAVLDDLAQAANVDARRIFATGMSNGAIMAYRLADELSDRIAAIAPVSGAMGSDAPKPKRPVPVLHFHGTEDKFAPFAGGRGERSVTDTNHFSVQQTIDTWVKLNGCPAEPKVEKLPDTHEDGTTVTRAVYGPGKDGSEVILVTIEGGGHTWPGRPSRLVFLGETTTDISANDMMWEFFERHPLPQ